MSIPHRSGRRKMSSVPFVLLVYAVHASMEYNWFGGFSVFWTIKPENIQDNCYNRKNEIVKEKFKGGMMMENIIELLR